MIEQRARLPLSGTRPTPLLPGRAAWIGRAVWALYAALAVGLTIAQFPTLYAGASFPGVGTQESDLIRAGLVRLGINPDWYAIYRIFLDQATSLFELAIAAILIWRKASERVVLLIAIMLVADIGVIDPPALAALAADHPVQAAIGAAMTVTRMTLLLTLFFVFPDGRLIPRWGILPIAAWFVQVIGVTFLHDTPLDSWDWPPLPTAIGFALLFFPAIYAQIDRYRRVSGPVERQQTKWAIGGLLIAIVGFAVTNVWLAAQQNSWAAMSPVRAAIADFTFNTIFTFVFVAVPVSLAIAVFKYRLFAIDAIINRAIVYGGLTAAVIATYVLVVGYLGTLFRTSGNLAISLVATGLVAIIFQPLRERLQRGANRLLYGERDEPYAVISRLGQRLEGTLTPDAILPTIVETVAGALKLPYAAIALGTTPQPAIAAATGTPIPNPVRLPLAYQGEPVGELLLAPRTPGETFSRADRRLLDDLARQAGVAAQAVRLADEARQLAADLQASRERLVLAREEERRRLRRDLHDGLGPRLAALTLRLDTARDTLADDPRADALLGDLADRTEEAVADIRRLVYALRPPALDDLGLAGALRQAADGYGPGPLQIAVEVPEALPPLPAAVEVAAYRIATEALTNAVRHAGANRCTIRIALDGVGETLRVEVADDGRGVAPGRQAGIGTASMRERAEELGGTLSIEPAPVGGTRVCAALPCRPLSDNAREDS
ncbi:MAG: sensor histidine kinase [Chloroflexia bacterium]